MTPRTADHPAGTASVATDADDVGGAPINSVEVERFFATEWRATADQLSRMLARHGVSPSDRDDIVQETAVRLLRVWCRIDVTRGAGGYAQAIALNVLRDELRRPARRRELATDEVEECSARDSVERVALARIEVSRVGRALRKLALPEQRLLTHCDGATGGVPGAAPAAVRMARMRARRRLEAALASSAG